MGLEGLRVGLVGLVESLIFNDVGVRIFGWVKRMNGIGIGNKAFLYTYWIDNKF